MRRRPGVGSGVHVVKDFVEADLDAAFALLAFAEMHNRSEGHGNALRAVEDAEKVILDGQQRLRGLNDSDRKRLGLQLERIHAVIEGIRSNLK
jgi:hypothetical protein